MSTSRQMIFLTGNIALKSTNYQRPLNPELHFYICVDTLSEFNALTNIKLYISNYLNDCNDLLLNLCANALLIYVSSTHVSTPIEQAEEGVIFLEAFCEDAYMDVGGRTASGTSSRESELKDNLCAIALLICVSSTHASTACDSGRHFLLTFSCWREKVSRPGRAKQKHEY